MERRGGVHFVLGVHVRAQLEQDLAGVGGVPDRSHVQRRLADCVAVGRNELLLCDEFPDHSRLVVFGQPQQHVLQLRSLGREVGSAHGATLFGRSRRRLRGGAFDRGCAAGRQDRARFAHPGLKRAAEHRGEEVRQRQRAVCAARSRTIRASMLLYSGSYHPPISGRGARTFSGRLVLYGTVVLLSLQYYMNRVQDR